MTTMPTSSKAVANLVQMLVGRTISHGSADHFVTRYHGPLGRELLVVAPGC